MDMSDTSVVSGAYIYTISGATISSLNEVLIQWHSAEYFQTNRSNYLKAQVETIEIDSVLFSINTEGLNLFQTSVIQQNENLLLACNCNTVNNKLCSHQSQALYNVLMRTELRIFFDPDLRLSKLKTFAEPYGLQNDEKIERYFSLQYENNKTTVSPSITGLIPVSREDIRILQDQLFENDEAINFGKQSTDRELFLVFKKHKYYRHLVIDLIEASVTQDGKPKNPFIRIDPLEKIWVADNVTESNFFSAINFFQNQTAPAKRSTAFEGLKSILRNPLSFNFYQHNNEFSENVVAGSISRIEMGKPIHDLRLSVKKEDPFYEISAYISYNEKFYNLEDISVSHEYFLKIADSYSLPASLKLLKTIEFFKEHNNKLLVHHSKFEEFRENTLGKLDSFAEIKYTYLKPATPQQLAENNLDKPAEKIIYLKDSDPFVELDLVFKYGETEISVLGKNQIYPKGIKTTFIVSRDKEAEISFIALVTKQHDIFSEQLDDGLPYFYLHKKHFLDEEWFLKTFEEWQSQGITILGFNKLKDNKLNPNQAKITVRLLSGIDWFNADIEVKYGKKKASLTQINKAIRNKSKYIQLGDGTVGILPQSWIEKFSEYFSNGEIVDDSLKIAKSNFTAITELFEHESLDDNIKAEINFLNEKLRNFESIEEVEIPAELNATLRDYQKQGLNWLNFLDDFNLGGCLADDMGLGKSLQIIAFILSQRKKRTDNTNLLVVPTSLIFNWQAEVEKFAPSLKTYTLYGANRAVNAKDLNDYELILTSYGTLVSDIRFLKNFNFNYVFLDESQNIKNPDSQRYKSARLLKSRNKIVITGTPIENNTFDLYGQLSFACPGLLGSKQYFKDIYSGPIDKFKDSKRALMLQKKIQPFILRRTKKQVAKELPAKTEIVLYCEMGTEQRKIYDAFEREFRDFICSKTEVEIPKSSIHVLKGLTRLRQICNSPVLLNDEDITEKASAKIEMLMEQILSKSPQHKILVFSQFVTMLDLIKAELVKRNIDFSYLTGGTKNRNIVVNEFQQDESKRVFLISLKAGGTGLNLTEADYVYLVDPWWNPAVENQAIDRIYRIGQQKNVIAVRLICPDTIEEKIMLMQQSKIDLFNNLISNEVSIEKSFTKKSLLSLLNTV